VTEPVDRPTDQAAHRDPAGRWVRGVCGNKLGRPRGAGWTQQTREALRGLVGPIIETLHRQALAGDVGASKLLLERVLPAARPGDEAVTLGAKGTLAAKAETIVSAAMTGRIGTAQGKR